jgi:hypothetical protein
MDDLMQMIQDKDRLIRELLKELVHYKDSVADAEAEMLSQQATIIEQRAELGERVPFEIVQEIAHEAHMMGRVYHAGGEKAKPAQTYKDIERMIHFKAKLPAVK